MNTSWQDAAACRGMNTDLFFANRADIATRNKARRVCRSCPVTAQCAQFAIDTGSTAHGMWGGLTRDALAALAHLNRLAATAAVVDERPALEVSR